MSGLILRKRILPIMAIGASLALTACASNGNGATRYGGTFSQDGQNCCQPVVCCQAVQAPIQRPVVEVLNVVEVPAPTPAPIIEYVYEQPAPVYTPPPVIVHEPTPVPTPAPVYTPQPAPVYTPQPVPVPSCPEGYIPAYGGQGCIPVVPLRK